MYSIVSHFFYTCLFMHSVTHGHHHSLFPVSGGVFLQFARCHCLDQKPSHLAPLAERVPTKTISGSPLTFGLETNSLHSAGSEGLSIPTEVALGHHHRLGKLLHLNLLHSGVVVLGSGGEGSVGSAGTSHTEGQSLSLGQLGLSVLSVHVLDSVCHASSLQ